MAVPHGTFDNNNNPHKIAAQFRNHIFLFFIYFATRNKAKRKDVEKSCIKQDFEKAGYRVISLLNEIKENR